MSGELTNVPPWSDEFTEQIRLMQEWLWNRNPNWSPHPPTKEALKRAQWIAVHGERKGS